MRIAATLASAIAALEGSVTRPVRDALVDWARRPDEEKTSNRHAARPGTRIISPQGNAGAVSVSPPANWVNTQKGRLPTPQKRDASCPSAEINESNIWVLWENPTDKDDTRRCALR